MTVIENEEFYVWVAPDGTAQLATLSSDEASCIAIARVYHMHGFGRSPHEMRIKGFKIVKVLLTLKQVYDYSK